MRLSQRQVSPEPFPERRGGTRIFGHFKNFAGSSRQDACIAACGFKLRVENRRLRSADKACNAKIAFTFLRKRGLSKNPGRAREGRSPFALSIVPGDMCGGAVLRRGIPFLRAKIASLQFSLVPQSGASENWRGWSQRGSISPVRQLVKNPFLTSCPALSRRGVVY